MCEDTELPVTKTFDFCVKNINRKLSGTAVIDDLCERLSTFDLSYLLVIQRLV